MNIDDLNTTQSPKGSEDLKFFQNADIPFDESKEEIWDKISTQIENAVIHKPKTSFLSALWLKLVTAFIVVIITGGFLFIQFYSIEIKADRGARESHVFPDGSTVDLNADSRVIYNPYTWSSQRNVTLTGEAFFDVKEGSPFKVVSDNGVTKVLGTRFNINTRDDGYKVYCEEGAVSVFSVISQKDLRISAGEMAVYEVTGVGVIEKNMGNEVLSWKSNKFNFNKVPLDKVLTNLEIQYDITISKEINDISNYSYTGRFNKTKSPETALDIICQSFNLTFTKLNSRNYKVTAER
ncbi:FecR family protein [bacterium SCSIO 12643]|nr:FecR family protein [bacterium SCSIO 12643]